MAKERFRKIKKGRQHDTTTMSSLPTYPYASATIKTKAFLTDSFMLIMPILYVVIYFIMGGREAFSEHKILGWFYIFVPLVLIQTIFLFNAAQTPGYRAYDLKIIDERTGKKPTLFTILFRNFCAILSFFSILGWVMMFFRKDAKSLHDLLSRTAIITI